MATLNIISAPEFVTSGYAVSTSRSSLQADNLVWEAEAHVMPPAGSRPEDNVNGPGSFTLSGDLVVQLKPEAGDVVGALASVRINSTGIEEWDLDPLNSSVWGTSSVQLTAGLSGTTPWFSLTGGQDDPDHNSWSSDLASGNGVSVIDTTIGGTFRVTIIALASSDGTWVGASGDFHGELSAGLNIQMSVECADLIAVQNPDSTNPTEFYWNSLADGGGFTCTYTIDNPYNLTIPDTTIDFNWQDAEGRKTIAYSFPLTDDAVDKDAHPAKDEGEHTIKVSNAKLVNPAPEMQTSEMHIIPCSYQPARLLMTIDPGKKVDESDEDNNTENITVVPLVIEVVTHGYNPDPGDTSFITPFRDLGTAITSETTITPGSILDNRVVSYVPQWNSTSYFDAGFKALIASKILAARAEIGAGGEDPTELLKGAKKLANWAAQAELVSIYDRCLTRAANGILSQLLSSCDLLSPSKSNSLQHIELIGHSRGSAVNALVAQGLRKAGFENVSYISLDGYSSDWADGTGILTTKNVAEMLAQTPYEATYFRAAEGLSHDEFVLDKMETLVPPAVIKQLQIDDDRNPWLAPAENIIGNSTHTNITQKFTTSYLNQTYVGQNGSAGIAGPSNQPTMQSPMPLSSQVPAQISQAASSDLVVGASGSLSLSITSISTGFVDGNFEQLGQIYSQILAISSPITLDPWVIALVNQWFNAQELLGFCWETSGNVQLATQDGNSHVELSQTPDGGTSLSQLVTVFSDATALAFDLGTVVPSSDAVLDILFNGLLVGSLPVPPTLSTTRQSVVLPVTGDTTGTFTFRLSGPSTAAATITLDNLEISMPVSDIVTVAADVVDPLDGLTSLREAVNYANDHAGDDTITFDSSLVGQTITLTSGQLDLTDTTGVTTITGLGSDQLTVSGNNASRVFYIDTGVTAGVSGLTMANGSVSGSDDRGGGICNYGTLVITNSTISRNSASYGGGIFNDGMVTITDSTIVNNSADYSGGIYNYGPLTIANSTIAENLGNYGSGGIYNYGWLTIANSTIAENLAPYGDGGGIYNDLMMTITDSTIAKNVTGEGSGGGICNYYGRLTIANSTIAENLAPYGDGGGIYSYDNYGTLTLLSNTIVASNGGKSTSSDVCGTVTANYCLIEDTTGTRFSGGSANNLFNVAPLLGVLGDCGGTTQTIPLLTGSPAIDTGSNALIPDGVTIDQRGYARIVNSIVDIGAYEALSYPVDGNTSPIADAGGPYVGTEGNAITLDASASSDPDGDAIQYRWDFDSDGVWDTDWSADGTATYTWADNWSGTATVAVSDGSHVATAMASVTVDNLLPTTATISAPADGYSGVRGQERAFVLTASDPSSVDQAAEFTFTLDWGDGQTETVVRRSGETVSHVFALAKTYVVKITAVADKDGGTTALSGVQQTLSIRATEMQGTALAVGGTTGDDTFAVTSGTSANTVSVSLNRVSQGAFSGVASVLCFGQGGTDTVQVFGTSGGDSFSVDGDLMTINGITVAGHGIESRLAKGGAGNDGFLVSAAEISVPITIDGSAGSGDKLTGPDLTNLWQLTGYGAGTLNAAITFKNIEYLTGGVQTDAFQIMPAGALYGKIDGNGGSDSLDYTAHAAAATVNLGTKTATAAGTIANIEQFVGSTAADTLVGANMTNNWLLTGANAGTLNNGTFFSGFENLTGGSGADAFMIRALGAGPTGTLNGGSGTDTVFGFNDANLWTLSGTRSGNVNGLSFVGIENVTGGSGADSFVLQTAAGGFGTIDGGAGAADVLIGPDAVNVWQLTAWGQGVLNGSMAFRNMENLTGGSLNDTFQLRATGAVHGRIDGGSGTNVLDYSLFGTLGVTVNLQTGSATSIGGGAAGRLSGFRVVVGTMGADTLIGDAGHNVLIGGSGADTLQGGDGRDLLIGGTGADQLNGGAGEDIIVGCQCSYYPESTRTLNLTAINAIMAEWTRTDLGDVSDPTGYLARHNHLIASNGGLNGSYLLNATTIQKDSSAIDSLFGGTDRDWFLADSDDLLTDRVASGDETEELTLV